jgi:hypothetical protein
MDPDVPDWRAQVPSLSSAQRCQNHPDQPPAPACRKCVPPTPAERTRRGVAVARAALAAASIGDRDENTTDCPTHGENVPSDAFGRCLICRPVRERSQEEIEASQAAAVAAYHAANRARLRASLNPPGIRLTPNGAVLTNKPRPEPKPIRGWRTVEEVKADLDKIIDGPTQARDSD